MNVRVAMREWKSGFSFVSFTGAPGTVNIVSCYDVFEICPREDTDMAGKNVAVFGIYLHRATCEYALSVFNVAGFRVADISILLQERPEAKDLAAQKAPGGIATSTDSAARIGSTFAWLTGTSAITVPGRAPLIVAGPIVAAVAGKGAGGAVGGLAEAITWLGMPESKARKFQDRIEGGGILLSMRCETPACVEKAKVLLISTGAEEISYTNEPEEEPDGMDRPRRRATSG
jgi:hypothetical protein